MKKLSKNVICMLLAAAMIMPQGAVFAADNAEVVDGANEAPEIITTEITETEQQETADEETAEIMLTAVEHTDMQVGDTIVIPNDTTDGWSDGVTLFSEEYATMRIRGGYGLGGSGKAIRLYDPADVDNSIAKLDTAYRVVYKVRLPADVTLQRDSNKLIALINNKSVTVTEDWQELSPTAFTITDSATEAVFNFGVGGGNSSFSYFDFAGIKIVESENPDNVIYSWGCYATPNDWTNLTAYGYEKVNNQIFVANIADESATYDIADIILSPGVYQLSGNFWTDAGIAELGASIGGNALSVGATTNRTATITADKQSVTFTLAVLEETILDDISLDFAKAEDFAETEVRFSDLKFTFIEEITDDKPMGNMKDGIYFAKNDSIAFWTSDHGTVAADGSGNYVTTRLRGGGYGFQNITLYDPESPETAICEVEEEYTYTIKVRQSADELYENDEKASEAKMRVFVHDTPSSYASADTSKKKQFTLTDTFQEYSYSFKFDYKLDFSKKLYFKIATNVGNSDYTYWDFQGVKLEDSNGKIVFAYGCYDATIKPPEWNFPLSSGTQIHNTNNSQIALTPDSWTDSTFTYDASHKDIVLAPGSYVVSGEFKSEYGEQMLTLSASAANDESASAEATTVTTEFSTHEVVLTVTEPTKLADISMALGGDASVYVRNLCIKSEITATGSCGDNLTWTLYHDGELVISGTGEMWDCTDFSSVPWYSYRLQIKTVTIESGVTSIGKYAFFNYDGLTSVTIPNSVTSIGNIAFSDCGGLTSVTIPDSVTSIGNNAFSSCEALTSVTIPDSVTSIGSNAFGYCDNLTGVSVDENNEYYSSDEYGVLFNKDKTTLIQYPIGNERTSYDIPDSVTSIAYYAFASCYSLTSVSVDENNEYYSNDEYGVLFNKDKTTLIQYPIGNERTSYDIPGSVTSIGGQAFYNCCNLTSITIPDSVTSIDDYAFRNCNSLTSATIYSRDAQFGWGVFAGTHNSLTIHAYAGSTAEAYANENGHNFVALDERTVTATGECGDNLTWTLYSDGEFVISGTGEMTNWSSYSSVPWDSYRSWIVTATIEDGVTSIGNYAFYECSLTSVDIPDSVTSIGGWAFCYCRSLMSVDIPEGVTSIGFAAFFGCSNLTSVYIPEGVTSINDKAFARCSSLTSITVDESNANYSNDEYGVLFNKNKTTLMQYPIGNTRTSYNIPEGVTSIRNAAFYYCSSLMSVTIPEGVTSIGTEAFCYCDNLTSVDIPDSVTSIGLYAFQRCRNLTSVDIPDSVTSIGDYAFRYCTNLTSATIYSRNATFGSNVFYDTADGFTIYACAGSTAETYASENGHTFVALEEPERPVTATGECGDNLTWTLYGDGELVISGTGEMWDWTSGSSVPWYSYRLQIKTVTIESGVTSIGAYAFDNCDSLTSVTIPDSVTNIGNDAFNHCDSLTSVSIGNGVVSVDSWAFAECYSLTGVYITDIKAWCGIEFCDEPSNPLCYAENLYLNDKLITELNIPDSITSIGDYAFEYCDSLTSVTIPDSVTSIGEYAFAYCDSLTSVDIPDSVTSIGDYAFECCDSLTSVDIPDSVTSIGDGAFWRCTSLTSVTIPDSVTSIGDYAFEYCDSLTSVDIPEGVTSIGEEAFAWCDILTSATIYSRDAAFGSNVFYRTSTNFTIHAYAGSTAETYASKNGHKFVALEETTVDITDAITSTMTTPESATVTAPTGGWVEGENTFSVSADLVCFVLVSNDGGKTYDRVTATANADGSYSFTANLTANSSITVAIAGDSNGDGKFTNADATRLKAHLGGKVSLGAKDEICADASNGGGLSNADVTRIKAALGGKRALDW